MHGRDHEAVPERRAITTVIQEVDIDRLAASDRILHTSDVGLIGQRSLHETAVPANNLDR